MGVFVVRLSCISTMTARRVFWSHCTGGQASRGSRAGPGFALDLEQEKRRGEGCWRCHIPH